MKFSDNCLDIGYVQPCVIDQGGLTYHVETKGCIGETARYVVVLSEAEVTQMYNEIQELKGRKLEWS